MALVDLFTFMKFNFDPIFDNMQLQYFTVSGSHLG